MTQIEETKEQYEDRLKRFFLEFFDLNPVLDGKGSVGFGRYNDEIDYIKVKMPPSRFSWDDSTQEFLYNHMKNSFNREVGAFEIYFSDRNINIWMTLVRTFQVISRTDRREEDPTSRHWEKAHVRINGRDYVLSQAMTEDHGYELMLFRASKDGDVTNWLDVWVDHRMNMDEALEFLKKNSMSIIRWDDTAMEDR